MKFIFDAYDWRARAAPAFIVSLPVITTLTSCFEWPGPVLGRILGGAIWLLLIYILTIPVRNSGVSIEPALWEKWDGPPSTVMMRWRDNRIGKDLKRQYHDAVRIYLKLPMPSEKDEATDPKKADELTTQAFQRVRAILRDNDPKGLWSTNNANYGLHRNLLGSRKLWVFFCIGGIIVSGFFGIVTKDRVIIGGLAGNIVIFLLALYLGWSVLPKSVKHAAFRYAESAWESFLNIAVKEG